MNIGPATPPRPLTEADLPRIAVVHRDEPARRALETLLLGAGWRPVLVSTPKDAYDLLTVTGGPRLALVDTGSLGAAAEDLIRDVRRVSAVEQPYVIALTAADTPEGVALSLDAGADDTLAAPCTPTALQARVRVGLRLLAMHEALEACARDLDAAAAQVKQLQSLLPICSYCRRIRDDEHHWQHLDEYLSYHTQVRFTHGFCPQCYERHVQPTLAAS